MTKFNEMTLRRTVRSERLVRASLSHVGTRQVSLDLESTINDPQSKSPPVENAVRGCPSNKS
jgi:hypothetical protein